MGFSGIGMWELLIILAIVVMIFGTKKLKSIGADLGGAIRGFKQSMSEPGKDEGGESPRLGKDAEFSESAGDSAGSSKSSASTKSQV
jgi:sec-independent protein translocase protein TatA